MKIYYSKKSIKIKKRYCSLSFKLAICLSLQYFLIKFFVNTRFVSTKIIAFRIFFTNTYTRNKLFLYANCQLAPPGTICALTWQPYSCEHHSRQEKAWRHLALLDAPWIFSQAPDATTARGKFAGHLPHCKCDPRDPPCAMLTCKLPKKLACYSRPVKFAWVNGFMLSPHGNYH